MQTKILNWFHYFRMRFWTKIPNNWSHLFSASENVVIGAVEKSRIIPRGLKYAIHIEKPILVWIKIHFCNQYEISAMFFYSIDGNGTSLRNFSVSWRIPFWRSFNSRRLSNVRFLFSKWVAITTFSNRWSSFSRSIAPPLH